MLRWGILIQGHNKAQPWGLCNSIIRLARSPFITGKTLSQSLRASTKLISLPTKCQDRYRFPAYPSSFNLMGNNTAPFFQICIAVSHSQLKNTAMNDFIPHFACGISFKPKTADWHLTHQLFNQRYLRSTRSLLSNRMLWIRLTRGAAASVCLHQDLIDFGCTGFAPFSLEYRKQLYERKRRGQPAEQLAVVLSDKSVSRKSYADISSCILLADEVIM